jgi:hypothetical protein
MFLGLQARKATTRLEFWVCNDCAYRSERGGGYRKFQLSVRAEHADQQTRTSLKLTSGLLRSRTLLRWRMHSACACAQRGDGTAAERILILTAFECLVVGGTSLRGVWILEHACVQGTRMLPSSDTKLAFQNISSSAHCFERELCL